MTDTKLAAAILHKVAYDLSIATSYFEIDGKRYGADQIVAQALALEQQAVGDARRWQWIRSTLGSIGIDADDMADKAIAALAQPGMVMVQVPSDSELAIEAKAQEIYESWDCTWQGRHYPWTPGGNSDKQQEARAQARAMIAAAQGDKP